MAYTTLDIDESGRLIGNCPICGNDHLSDNYCSVCGIYIKNECSGEIKKYDDNGYEYIERNTPCDTPLKGADRYCPICGAESTFYQNKLLRDWYKSNRDDPFGRTQVDISDDDLPF